MKTTAVVFLICTASLQCFSGDFLRNLPDPKFGAQLTPEKIKNTDAVIILKEQSLTINNTDFTYHGYDFRGLAMTTTTIVIAKVFDQSAVSRFGSFEREYPERFGDEFKSGFACRARVQKPDGQVLTMPESGVNRVVSEENSSGEPIARKVIFKVPNLAPGDVVQIEYTLTEPLVRAMSGIFYYNDNVPVLFSNVMITLPADEELKVYSFPADRVGEPKLADVSNSLGAGSTYFWGLKSLNAIPREPHTYTFGDLSLMTAFVVNPKSENGYRRIVDWNFIASEYFRDYVEEGSVKQKRIAGLGFGDERPVMSMHVADSLYTAIRRSIALKSRNSIYPAADDIEDVFKKGRGDASDLAYIFYKILHEWKADVRVAWIRDRREGSYEQTVPTIHWFDRMGVLVRVGNDEKMYDFDRSVPAHYAVPSYLASVTVPLVGGKACEQKVLPAAPGPGSFIREMHDLTFKGTQDLDDSLTYACNGSPAEEYRRSVYDLHGGELTDKFKSLATARCLADVDTVVPAAVLDDPEIDIAYRGRSKASVAAVDRYLTVKLTNEALKRFRDEIFSAVRVNDLVLNEPLTISVSWQVRPPAGYAVRTAPRDTTFKWIQGCAGVLHDRQGDGGLQMQAELKFTERVIPATLFPRVIRTLDDLIAASEQPIVLAKQ